MTQERSTPIEETLAAARGVFALIIGDRQAARHFDFGPRGLVGSFIALLTITAFNAYLPLLLGVKESGIGRSVIMVAILFVMQLAFSAIVLKQLKRMDGLVPYLVADNWATFFITLFSNGLMLAGLTGDIALIGLGLLVLAVEINIARLILGLSPLRIAMFLVAQMVGVSVGLVLIGFLFPLSPADMTGLVG